MKDVNFQQTLQRHTTSILERLESSKIVFFARIRCTGPCWGSLRRSLKSSPRPSSRPVRGIPPPHFPPVDAFGFSTLGASNSTPSASRVRRSPCAPNKTVLALCLLYSGAGAGFVSLSPKNFGRLVAFAAHMEEWTLLLKESLKSVKICRSCSQNGWLCRMPHSPYTFVLKDAELAR